MDLKLLQGGKPQARPLDHVAFAGQVHVLQRLIKVTVLTHQEALHAFQMFGNDLGDVVGIGVSSRPIIQQQPPLMAGPEFGLLLIQLDDEASLLLVAGEPGLGAAERYQRWLDHFDLQSGGVRDVHKQLQEFLVGHRQ